MLDQRAVSQLVGQLRTYFSPEDIQAAVERYYDPTWPGEYHNAETGESYRPHHDYERRFVFTDTPPNALCKGGEGAGKSVSAVVKTLERLRRGMSGLMICVAADTLVDGVPIAERTEPAPVNTLLGPAWASSSFREGRADLFRVVTESGDRVVVTTNHRFLTPTGFCPLRDLRVGSLVAVDDSEHGHAWREISPGSLADCWLDPRLRGEPASPEGRRVPGKQLLLDGGRVNNLSLPHNCCNTIYTRIASITFRGCGDFYGLAVPSVGHYSAQGLIHHNSPDLPHFKRSLWPEFRRWCPWSQVVPEQRYRSRFSWEPRDPFTLAFRNGTTLTCGGIDDPGAWEGPNVSFAYFDEARRKKGPEALKTLTGRVRIPGPKGEPPQLYISTTPRKHWLYDYFGPLRCRCARCGHRYEHYHETRAGHNYVNVAPELLPICPKCNSPEFTNPDDPQAAFKLKALVITLLTEENEPHLQTGFTENRALSLTASEARVLLAAEWEDIESSQRFLPDMIMWDNCKESLPALGPREPLVVAMDAATGRTSSYSDCFGMVGVTRHPDPTRRENSVAVRYVHKWQARPGGKIDFLGSADNPGPEIALRYLVTNHNVIVVVFDPDQLHDMGMRLTRERLAWMLPFTQRSMRVMADSDLLNLITHRRLAHDGNPDLREHVDNADKKLDSMDRKLRIVKREEGLKVDLAVCLSMAAFQCLRLNL